MSDRLVHWIEHFCRRPTGLRKGDRVLLAEEQFEQIEENLQRPGICSQKGSTAERRAGMMGREFGTRGRVGVVGVRHGASRSRPAWRAGHADS